jgi:long-chain acyl-CoA synthetase
MGTRTIYSVLRESAAQFGSRPALHQPVKGAASGYQSWNWVEYLQAVEEAACGMRLLGIRRRDVVALGSETRAEFYLADIGAMTAGAAAAAMYTSYPAEEQVRTLRACGAKLVFVENPKMLASLRAAGGDQLDLRWALLTGEAEGVTTLQEIRDKGRQAMLEDPNLVRRLEEEVQPSDYAILYLTSGATGEPKMVFVTHDALVSNVDMGPFVLSFTAEDCALAFLPSAHIAQRIAIELLTMRMGCQVYFSESLSKMPAEFRTVRPTFFLAPPRVWERIFASISTEIRKRGTLARQLFYGALGLGQEAARLRREGKPVPAWMAQILRLADRVLFRKIRDRFGGRMHRPISGAAPLSKELGLFYEIIGMPLYEGYGLTEGGIVSLNPFDAPRLGTIGKPLPGIEVKLSAEGELLIKSPTLMSCYFNDPDATAEVLRGGWLHTGDLADISADGYVSITGRKKEMIVSSNGKKIYPARVESLFKTEPLISQMILLGDRQPYVTALFTVNPAAAAALKGMEDFKDKSAAEIAAAKPVYEEIRKAVKKANSQLAPFEQIRKFRILDRDFSIEDGELTPTMKVRRTRVISNHRSAINELYSGQEEER